MSDFSLPDRFRDTEHLEDVMTTPPPELINELGQRDGDIIVLGVGGKIGPTLARLAKRAAPEKRVVGVGASAKRAARGATAQGIECIEADLLIAPGSSVAELPNVIFMAGFNSAPPA